MKKQFLLGAVACSVIASLSAGITHAAVNPQGHIVTDSAVIQKVHADDLFSTSGKLSQLSEQARQTLAKSVFTEIEKHGVVNYWIPSIFVKADESEYVLGFKNVDSSKNELLSYKLEGHTYSLSKNMKSNGLIINPQLSVNK